MIVEGYRKGFRQLVETPITIPQARLNESELRIGFEKRYRGFKKIFPWDAVRIKDRDILSVRVLHGILQRTRFESRPIRPPNGFDVEPE